MKSLRPLFLLVACLAVRLAAQTTFVSNIDSTTPNGVFVYSTQWLARGFTTGSNATGYALDSVNLFLTTPGAPDGTFGVSLWSDNAGVPGMLIGSFTPAGGGQFTWGNGGTLPAYATFWVTASSTTAFDAAGSYAWWFTNSAASTSSGGWTLLAGAMTSANSSLNWSASANAYQFSVAATANAVPEPSTYAALAGALALGAVVWRRRVSSSTAR